MKSDLATSIGASVLGVIVAFLICNTLLPEIEAESFKKLDDAASSYELVDPDPEMFNYRSLNPTVEVYVGDCDEYDIYGNCIDPDDDDTKPEEEDTTDDTEDTETPAEENPSTPEPWEETEDGSTN